MKQGQSLSLIALSSFSVTVYTTGPVLNLLARKGRLKAKNFQSVAPRCRILRHESWEAVQVSIFSLQQSRTKRLVEEEWLLRQLSLHSKPLHPPERDLRIMMDGTTLSLVLQQEDHEEKY
jgi:hypothetical protein